MPRKKGKRGRDKLKSGEIPSDEVKNTEEDWLLSYHETCKPRSQMDVPCIFMNAKDYMKETSSHRLVFHILNDETSQEYLWFKECTNMLCTTYAEELERRFKGLDTLSGLGITFTKKSSQYTSVKNDYAVLMKAFNSIVEKIVNLRWIVAYHTVKGKKTVDRKETKRLRDEKREQIKALNKSMGLDSDKIEWFRVSEIGKSNYMAHIHAIFYGINFIPIEWLKKEWHKLTGDSYMVWVSQRNAKASSHAVKYITKTIKGKNLSMSLVMLWALNARAWGCSRSLLTEIRDHDKALILEDAGLENDTNRYTITCLGLYPADDFTGLYKIGNDP
jgi:hypothetical protein